MGRRVVAALMSLSLLAVGAAESETATMKITGYVDGYRDITAVRWDLITHTMVLYGIVHADGTVEVRTTNNFAASVSRTHQAGGKALLTLGAATRADWNTAVSTQAGRDRIVAQSVAIMDQFGFDGIDLDLETPYADSYGNWKALATQLSATLKPRGKLLTDALTAGVEANGTNTDGTFKYTPSSDGTLIGDDALALFDLLNVMAYDGHYYYTKNPALNAPYELFTAALDYWLARGVSPSKLAIGIPFYGVKAADGNNTNYKDLVAQGADPNNNSFNGWWYNGLDLVAKKTKYAQSKGAGVMLFHMAADDPAHSLAVAVKNASTTTPPPPVFVPDVPAAIVHNKATLDWMIRTKATGGLGYSVAKTKLTHAYLEMVALGGVWP